MLVLKKIALTLGRDNDELAGMVTSNSEHTRSFIILKYITGIIPYSILPPFQIGIERFVHGVR
jgi:hypothetical protein